MATSRQKSKEVERQPLILAVAKYSGQVGLGTGLAGFAIGGTAGLFRSANPGLFAIFSSAQCFSLGFLFTATRAGALEVLAQTQKTPVNDLPVRDRRIASTLGGAGAAITTGAIFRGRSNIVPGILVWSLVGLSGQYAYDTVIPRLQEQPKQREGPGFMERLIAMKWSPVTKLSDEQYENMLKEKLVRIEAEIALIDDDVAKLRGQNHSHQDD